MEPYRSVVESCLDFVELVDVVEEGEEDDWHNVKGSAVHLKQAAFLFCRKEADDNQISQIQTAIFCDLLNAFDCVQCNNVL